jgi:hypothetical protein
MLKWERIVNDILLENSYDLTMFSSKDISSFSESCKKVKLIETKEFDEEIDRLLKLWDEYVKNSVFMFDERTGWLFTVLDTIPIITIPDKTLGIEGGYNTKENNIYLFVNNLKELSKPEIRITLGHELEHYFYAQKASKKEKEMLISQGKSDEEYYENPSEFEAHKRAFIMAAEQLLYKNIDYSNVETDSKKLPKKNIYEFFKIMETGKLPLYAKWFNTLTEKQKQDLLNEMLHRFAESIENGGKLMLKESFILLKYYKN